MPASACAARRWPSTSTQPLPIKFSLQIDYKRFGVPVDVQAPPADETADYSAIAGGG